MAEEGQVLVPEVVVFLDLSSRWLAGRSSRARGESKGRETEITVLTSLGVPDLFRRGLGGILLLLGYVVEKHGEGLLFFPWLGEDEGTVTVVGGSVGVARYCFS